MRKQKILLLAAMCAAALAGCKKKEPIDLSSLHTTAAVEKESILSAEESDPAASTVSSNAESAAPGSQYSVNSQIQTFTDKNVTIEYPVLSNMKDAEKQKQVNELLKKNALAVQNAYPVSEDRSLSVKATVESVNLRRVTVTYRGEVKSGGESGRIFYSNTVDLETAQDLRLSNYADAYTVAGYIAHGDYKLEEAAASGETVKSFINSADKDVQYYYKQLAEADFGSDGQASWPGYFSFEKQGSVYISIPLSTPNQLGDYVLIRYSPDIK